MVTKYRWSAPRANNSRAWKRIEKGEWLWDRRRVLRVGRGKARYNPDTIKTFDMEKIEIDVPDWPHKLYRYERVPGSEREVVNYHRRPEVDFGG